MTKRVHVTEAQEQLPGPEVAGDAVLGLRRDGPSSDVGVSPRNILAQVVSRISTRNLPEPPPPPDGGFKAWTQVTMCFFVLFATWGYANSFGAFQAYYTENLPEAPSTISWIGGVQLLLSLVIGTISGRLFDAGFFLPTFLVGMALQVLGIILMSFSKKYYQLFLSQGVLSGIGAGLYFTPAVSVVNTYFDKRRALAIGLATTGNSAGGIVYPVLVRELIPKLGFPWATRVIGFLNFALLTIAVSFMRARLPPRKSSDLLDLKAFKEPAFTIYLTGAFFLFWANYYTFYYIGSYGTQALGLPLSSASVLVIIINGVGLPFRVAVPMVADRVGNVNVILVISVIWVIVAFSWLAVNSIPSYYAFTVVYGIVAASFQCLFPSTVARITKNLDAIGTRLGMAFSITALGSLTGPSIGGAIQTAGGGSFKGPQIWAAVSNLICCVFFIALKLHIDGLNWPLKWQRRGLLSRQRSPHEGVNS
ncbi:major facilitator superfamily domain-containing protein [Xylariaceae sp. FL0594]|nr:major facilitator superfamily domain-containing protein [Xylariaceae sp. FL0594]